MLSCILSVATVYCTCKVDYSSLIFYKITIDLFSDVTHLYAIDTTCSQFHPDSGLIPWHMPSSFLSCAVQLNPCYTDTALLSLIWTNIHVRHRAGETMQLRQINEPERKKEKKKLPRRNKNTSTPSNPHLATAHGSQSYFQPCPLKVTPQ